MAPAFILGRQWGRLARGGLMQKKPPLGGSPLGGFPAFSPQGLSASTSVVARRMGWSRALFPGPDWEMGRPGLKASLVAK